jgi:hypothetical protein
VSVRVRAAREALAIDAGLDPADLGHVGLGDAVWRIAQRSTKAVNPRSVLVTDHGIGA